MPIVLQPKASMAAFPDVAVQCAISLIAFSRLQLSAHSKRKYSARCTHYEREKAALIWVLFGFDPQLGDIPQSFVDVIRRHRGNAFIIDQESVAASYAQRTIMLKCFLANATGGFDSPRLVRLDELTFPKKWSFPYLEDRISKPLLDRIAARRRSCFAYLETIKGESYGVEKDGPERKTLLRELREITPHSQSGRQVMRDEELAILRLIACIFSIIHEVRGKRHIYGTKQPNVAAMLNTWLHNREDIQRCALILEHLLRHTPWRTCFAGRSVSTSSAPSKSWTATSCWSTSQNGR